MIETVQTLCDTNNTFAEIIRSNTVQTLNVTNNTFAEYSRIQFKPLAIQTTHLVKSFDEILFKLLALHITSILNLFFLKEFKSYTGETNIHIYICHLHQWNSTHARFMQYTIYRRLKFPSHLHMQVEDEGITDDLRKYCYCC